MGSSIELRDSKQLVESKTHTKQSVKPKRENSNEKAPSSKREAIKKRDNNREKTQVNNTHDTRKVKEPQRHKELVAETQNLIISTLRSPKAGRHRDKTGLFLSNIPINSSQWQSTRTKSSEENHHPIMEDPTP